MEVNSKEIDELSSSYHQLMKSSSDVADPEKTKLLNRAQEVMRSILTLVTQNSQFQASVNNFKLQLTTLEAKSLIAGFL
jgi:ElaB/YqjD/DUF883 family membrane-anchored ribosome-binding protein